MRCDKCKVEVNLYSKFCPECGNPISIFESTIKAEEVTVEWISSILKKLGFIVEPFPDRSNSLLARHDNRFNLLVALLPDIRIIGFQSMWKMKKPGWGKKDELMTALNRANNLVWLGSYALDDDMDSLTVTSHVTISENISERDVVRFLDLFESTISTNLKNSGLMAFA